MTTILPPIPRLVFTILEPLSLVAGTVAPFFYPAYFVSSQLASQPVHPLLPTEQLLALQIGNLYGLLCLVGVFVLNTTTEASVVHAYIWALLIADVGHVGTTAWMMGYHDVVDIANWNSMAMGNIGITAILFILRSMYLLGLFGKDRQPLLKGKKIR